MHLVDQPACGDPTLNLALEEYLVRRFPSAAELLMLYVNDQAVVLGRNQIPFVEAGLQALWRRRAALVRRISGGGAVYHDPGNLNFSWIKVKTRRDDPFPSPAEALEPVLRGLQALGLPARLNARHDILLEGRKISGVAQYRTMDRCLTHGTLLVSSDLEALEELLRSDVDVPHFRGRRSVRSQVTNIALYKPQLTIERVREALVKSFAARHGRPFPLSIASAAWTEIHEIARAKYRSWDWNIARSPAFTIRRGADLLWGKGVAEISIQRGIITRIEASLPKQAPAALGRLAEHLQGEDYRPAAVSRRIRTGLQALDLACDWRPLAEWLCPSWTWWC